MSSMKFYQVQMPDEKFYAISGASISDVAERLGVCKSKVTYGVDLMRTPDISQYYENQPQPSGQPVVSGGFPPDSQLAQKEA
ncbi:MAG: hypothetical protein GY832_11255 [Chloroflexi bacterium]|nr:hypothetical protein [Chloroflexota bacterium]